MFFEILIDPNTRTEEEAFTRARSSSNPIPIRDSSTCTKYRRAERLGATRSSLNDRESSCRSIADAASIETCDVPYGNDVFQGSGERLLSQRWVTPDVVINSYELSEPGRPGYRIQVVQLLN